MSAPAKRRPGRPTAYKPEYVDLAYKLALLGATDAQMAECFGISERTLNTWKTQHAEFLQALKNGKAPADAEVAASLFQRAKGFDGIPPDTLACIYWLKNRQPDQWRDRVEVKTEITGDPFPPVDVLDAIYAESLRRSAEREKILIGRRERLGLLIEQEPADDGRA